MKESKLQKDNLTTILYIARRHTERGVWSLKRALHAECIIIVYKAMGLNIVRNGKKQKNNPHTWMKSRQYKSSTKTSKSSLLSGNQRAQDIIYTIGQRCAGPGRPLISSAVPSNHVVNVQDRCNSTHHKRLSIQPAKTPFQFFFTSAVYPPHYKRRRSPMKVRGSQPLPFFHSNARKMNRGLCQPKRLKLSCPDPKIEHPRCFILSKRGQRPHLTHCRPCASSPTYCF